MSDTLATINVDQLSSAVNAVVQATAIGQLPLDPSPPPSASGLAAPPGAESSTCLLQQDGAVTPIASQCGGGARTVLTLPTYHAQHSQATMLPPAAPAQNMSVPTPGPVLLQMNLPNTRAPPNQVLTVPQNSRLNVQPQPVGRQVYMLKQIGNNLVLVPTASQNSLPQTTVDGRSVLQPVGRSSETMIYQPSAGLPRASCTNVAPPVCAQSTNLSTVGGPQPSHINMNIAIHLPNNGTAQSVSGINQFGGCGFQTATRPITAHVAQDSNQLMSQICNLVSSARAPSAFQPVQNNTTQLLILPNQSTGQVQPRPLNSHVTSVGPQMTFVTPAITGTADCIPIASNIAMNQAMPSVLTSNLTNVNLLSPTLAAVGAQGQLPSPLTSVSSMITQKAFPMPGPDSHPGGLKEFKITLNDNVDLQQALLKQSHDEAKAVTSQQLSAGVGKVPCLQTMMSSVKGGSEVTSRALEAKSEAMQKNPAQMQECHHSSCCTSCIKSAVRGCAHRRPSVVIQDKPIETRARQSLPDMLTLKPSSLAPGHIGVFAEQEVQGNTRFGPLVGKLTDVNSSNDLTAVHSKDWRIFSDGKPCQLLHVDDESLSNWMMFIRLSRRHCNLTAFQSGAHIYFTSFDPIPAGQELVVWYSKEYSRLRGFKEKRERSQECRKCSRRFADRTQLAQHMKYDHRPMARTAENRHKCDLCARSFPSLTKLNTHLLTHMGVKPHRCEVCGRGFSDRSNLRAHLMIHAGVKRFTCQICGKCFRQKVHLKSHQVTHTKERSLQCVICEKSFARHSDLSYHLRQHREGKRASCPVCDQKFWKDSQLRRHMKIHSGQRDFQCHLCGKGFITKYHLSRHLRSCEHDERFRRKPWPASSVSGQEAAKESPPGDGEERSHMTRKRGRRLEAQETVAPRVMRRSSRGRPIRPKLLPEDIDRLMTDGSPSRIQRRSRGMKQDFGQDQSVASSAVSVGDPRTVTLYEVHDESTPSDLSQPSSSFSQLVMSGEADSSKRTVAPGASGAIAVYGVAGNDAENSGGPGSSQQQQPGSTLSQLAITVPQESPMVLDCDSFTPSSSVTQSQLESGYTYSSADPPGADDIHDGSLTAPLFDLGESSSMSSSAHSSYNPQSFSLGEDVSHSDAFSEPQEHCSPARSLFMSDAAMSESVAGPSSQGLDHQAPGTSLAEDSLFSIDPSEDTRTSLPQHSANGMDDISVDLQAIQVALDSDEDEQCTDERRGDSPSENVEE